MGSALEDALRAAAAAAAAKGATATPATVAPASSPARVTKRNRNKRQWRRSRSESLASEPGAGDSDSAAQRLAAFKERMFEVGSDGASATFARETPRDDEVVQVQWKGKKPTRATHSQGNEDDEDAVPQLTRARVVVSKKPVEAQAPAAPTKPGKRKKNKKTSAAPVVHELKVPSMPAVPELKTRMPAAHAKKSTVRDDDALEFSDPSDNEDDINGTPAAPSPAKNAATSKVALLAAKRAAQKATKKPIVAIAQPPKKAVSDPTSKASKAFISDTPNGTKPAPKPTPKPAKTTSTTNPSVQTTGKPTTSSRSPNPTTSRPALGDKDQEDEDAKWDLDTLMKTTIKKAVQQPPQRKASVSDSDEAEDDDETHEFTGKIFRQHQMHLFSQLIDSAARERWELVEVGRLVRVFAAQWSHKKKKTARFLRRVCPELVSVDFLEGLNIPLSAAQLLAIFQRGSGSPAVLMTKIASAIENGNLSVRDEDVQSFVVDQTQMLATNREVVEFLVPLLESLSSVKDVGVLLKAVSEHWHVDRTAALVQDVLLTPVFDDLDGQPDELLEDLPALEGRLDFPSRMDDEDADENGNLQGLIAGEESDLGESDAHSEDAAEEELGEVLSDDADDSHAEDEVYEGETDSEEEREARERLNPTKRRRSRFLLEEADEDDNDEDDDEGFADDDEEDEGESDDSSDDSSDDDAPAKPQRKRLRQG